MLRLARLTSLCLLAFAPALSAQGRGVELGIDLEFSYTTDDPNVTVIQLPGGKVRVGFPVGRSLSLEPRLGFQYAGASGNNISLLELQLGLLWHASTDPARSSVYLRPFFGHTHAGGSLGSGDASSLGAGIGFKIPQGDRLALRIEGGYEHSLEDGVSGQIFAALGISFFTR